MKFFTMAWWAGTQPDADPPYAGVDPYQAYSDHLRSLGGQFPQGMLEISGTVALHDAKVRTVDYSVANHTLVISFDNFRYEGMTTWRFHLRYFDVTGFHIVADPDEGFGGPHGFGDLGYHEIDLADDGQVEHRLLFSSGIELEIRCRDAEVWWAENAEGD